MFVFLARTDPDAIRVRRWIVENFQCKGIVKLPAYTFYSKTPVNASVLFLRKPPAMPGVTACRKSLPDGRLFHVKMIK